jgi:hypothetical protein
MRIDAGIDEADANTLDLVEMLEELDTRIYEQAG